MSTEQLGLFDQAREIIEGARQTESITSKDLAFTFNRPSMSEARAKRDAAIEQVAENAGETFRDAAKRFVVAYLTRNGPSSGEDVTDACKAAGIVPPNDDRAFGAVYLALVRSDQIEKCGTVPRRKGHATAGGNVWRMVENA